MISLVFPGQGSQSVGMGKDFYESYLEARQTFEEADDSLKINLTRLIFDGPEEELKKTEFTQPAILTTSIAIYRVLKKEFGNQLTFQMVAGHSLGEYTANVVAESLSFASAVKLVNIRGKLMQEAVPVGVGTMAAVMGVAFDVVEDVCKQVEEQTKKVCEPANYNSPVQVVISGHVEAVRKATEILKEKGAKKIVELKVSAPFHCRLLRPVAEKFKPYIEEAGFVDAKCWIIPNYNVVPVKDAEQIKDVLYHQIYNPVRWSQSVVYMCENKKADLFIEIGPGKVLTGLIRKTVKGVKTLNVSKLSDLKSVEDLLAGSS